MPRLPVPTPPAWRLSVVTEGAAELKFILPCDDGSMSVLELTRRLVERCQSLTPSVPLVADPDSSRTSRVAERKAVRRDLCQ